MVQESWDCMYQQLKEFKEKNGTCNVRDRTLKLARWVQIQRTYYLKGKLKPEHIEALNCLGFTWRIQAAYKNKRNNDFQFWNGPTYRQHNHWNAKRSLH